MVRYIILGDGYIGNYLSQHLDDSFLYKGRFSNETVSFIKDLNPKYVINCIGKTGTPNTDWCETNRIDTFISNTSVPIILTHSLKDTDIKVIHIGTGCVYKGVVVSDSHKPNYSDSFYSRSKAFVEDVLENEENFINLRIRLPISRIESPRNFLYKVLKFDKVTKTNNSVTFLKDLVNVITFINDKDLLGTFNVVHPRETSAAEIQKLNGIEPNIVPQEELGIGPRADVIICPSRLLLEGFEFADFGEEIKW